MKQALRLGCGGLRRAGGVLGLAVGLAWGWPTPARPLTSASVVAPPPPSAANPDKPASSAHLAALDLLTLERQVRADPDAAAQALQARLTLGEQTAAQQLELLRLLGVSHWRAGQVEALLQVVQGLEQLGQQQPGVRADAQAAAACLRADLLFQQGTLAQTQALLQDTLQTLGPQGNANVRLQCLTRLASVKENRAQFDQAVQTYQDALRLAETQPAWRRSILLSGLAYTLFRAGQTPQARVANAEAMRLGQQADDPLALFDALGIESMLLADEQRPAEELAALQAAIEQARRAGARRDELLGLANLTDHYLRNGEPARALALAQQVQPLARQLRDGATETLAQLNSGLALIALHRKADGLKLVNEVLQRQQDADELVSLSETLLELGRYLEGAGEWAEALAAYSRERHLATQVAQRDQQRQVLELQASFDAERRRKDKALLLEDTQLQQEALKAEALRARLWLLSGLLVVLGLAALGLWYRRIRATQQQLRQHTRHLKQQSEQDPLTGLGNRRHLQAWIGAHPQAQGTLYLLDLDHFKQINDRHGHAGGDAVLVEVARRLQAVVREQDLVVRWGGEEFLIWVPRGHPTQNDLLARRLLTVLATRPVAVEGQSIPISASIGYAAFPLAAHGLAVPWELAIELVDSAMYLAKTQGRNRACGVRSVPAQALPELQALMSDLELAWRDGRVSLAEFHGPTSAGALA